MSERETGNTSRRRTQEQQRAAAAWQAIAAVKREHYAGRYKPLARGAPADIQTNGLGQTLAFLRAKGYESGRPKPNNEHARLFDDLSAWLRPKLSLTDSRDIVEWVANDADTNGYRRATTEALSYLAWLRRFAEAELGDSSPEGPAS